MGLCRPKAAVKIKKKNLASWQKFSVKQAVHIQKLSEEEA